MLTTNGTIMNEKIIKLFKENDFEFVVSIDGLEDIHTRNRPYISGKSSYKDVEKNIYRLRESFDKMIANMVVTKEDIPYTVKSVQKLWDMGIDYVNIALCTSGEGVYSNEDYMQWHEQMKILADMTYKNILNGTRKLVLNYIDLINTIHNRKPRINCGLFTNGVFTFSPSGDSYRCYKAVGNNKYKLGNIDDKNLELLEGTMEKSHIDKCTKCWGQLLCKDGCAYENESFKGDINTPNEEWCNRIKILATESLRIYAKLKLKGFQKYDELYDWG